MKCGNGVIVLVRIFSHRVMFMMPVRIILGYILSLFFNNLLWRHLESLEKILKLTSPSCS